MQKVDILAIGAHPDDVELGCGGTISKMIAAGKTVAIVDLTRGELGTRGTDLTRAEEAAKASEILKVSARENLEMKDGFLQNSEEYQLKIVKMIRKYQPTIVFSNALDDRHPDHAKGHKLVSDACFLAGLPKIETVLDGQSQTAWRPTKDFLESLTYRAQDLGRLSGVEFAEGFTTEKLLAFKNFDGIVL